MKTFQEVLGALITSRTPAAEWEIPECICRDSRRVTPGAVFVAIRGVTADGEKFIPAARANGAAVIIGERNSAESDHIAVSDSVAAYNLLVKHHFHCADEKLHILGVTGTNGKTSTVFLAAHFLAQLGHACGVVSTVETRDGVATLPAEHTTPDAEELWRLFANMAQSKWEYAAMEFSSHSLDQKRSFGVKCAAAIFTNLTGDHLDYHHDMESCYLAKKRLFTEHLQIGGTAIIDLDDEYGRRLDRELTCRKVGFSVAPGADWQIDTIRGDDSGSRFTLKNAAESVEFYLPLPGLHNIRNAVGVILALHALGFALADLARAAALPVRIPGRLERFELPDGALAFVDYAHTDDALENVLSLLRQLKPRRLIAVFGAGGNRDRSKRPRMGRAVEKYADELIVTSDNPRFEEPESIIAEIVAGITERARVTVEPDRARAIALALGKAERGDIVLVAGKGHETTQEIAGVKYPFSDAGEIANFCRK